MEQFARDIVTGSVSGAIYALIAAGLVLTYSTTGIFNLGYAGISFSAAYLYFAAGMALLISGSMVSALRYQSDKRVQATFLFVVFAGIFGLLALARCVSADNDGQRATHVRASFSAKQSVASRRSATPLFSSPILRLRLDLIRWNRRNESSATSRLLRWNCMSAEFTAQANSPRRFLSGSTPLPRSKSYERR